MDDSQTITIEGKEYKLNEFTQEQKLMLEHCVDLDKKMVACQFQFDQLRVGKDAFLKMFQNSLNKES